jgi:hypothetical protein
MKIYYHATDSDNLSSILDNGLKVGCDGVVYMTEKEDDAVKFVMFRGCKKIVVLKIKVYKRDEKNVVETFDHSPRFFKCRAFGYMGNIDKSNIEPVSIWDNPLYVNNQTS